MSTTVHLLDDDAAIRDALTQLLATVGWQVKAYASEQAFLSGNATLSALTGCLLLDIRMPGKSGLMLLDEWRQRGMDIPVIIMTGHANIELCRRAFKSGACEFLTKPIDADVLFEVVGSALTEHAAQLTEKRQQQRLQDKMAALTAREREVLHLLMQGEPGKVIARQLSLSPRTVEAHRASIFSKLEVNSLPRLIHIYSVALPGLA
ncbi:MAG: Transcriptional regulatory protein FixJ [Candidatus Erwinia impunctatus]|nr:Transcriptional regulatory protein FixJ [Culicoides impunctatus]